MVKAAPLDDIAPDHHWRQLRPLKVLLTTSSLTFCTLLNGAEQLSALVRQLLERVKMMLAEEISVDKVVVDGDSISSVQCGTSPF